MMVLVAKSTNNSLFATRLYPELRFLIGSKLKAALARYNDHCISINLFELLSDAVGFGDLWARLGVDYTELLDGITCIQSLSEGITTDKVQVSIKHLRDLIVKINMLISSIELMLNNPQPSAIIIDLVLNTRLQRQFERLGRLCSESPAAAKRMQVAEIAGSTCKFMHAGVNVLTRESYEQLGEFLATEESCLRQTETLAQVIEKLNRQQLQCVNVRAFTEELSSRNAVAKQVMAKAYLSTQGIAFVSGHEED